MALLETLCIAGFAAVHLFIGRIRWLDTVPRSRWLSVAGGVAAAYIVLHVLPELTEHHRNLSETAGRPGVRAPRGANPAPMRWFHVAP
ncbi:hypothetical protein HL658_02640 [Azospirillum sp. RWY-5-1]|nr:hypothetical protein [Azospirillum oleiclasticum]